MELTELGELTLERVGEERTQFLAEMLDSLDDGNLGQLAEAANAIMALAEAYAEPEKATSGSARRNAGQVGE